MHPISYLVRFNKSSCFHSHEKRQKTELLWEMFLEDFSFRLSIYYRIYETQTYIQERV